MGLVKTVRFSNPKYIGDPRNAVKIFNDKEVDELILLDIDATSKRKEPQFHLVKEIVSEAFMPVAYGGGLSSIEHIRKILAVGVEKVVLCSQAVHNPSLVEQAATLFGSSTVVVSIDVRRRMFGTQMVFANGGRKATRFRPVEFAKTMVQRGAGEIIVNSIDRDGTMAGYDVELIRSVADAVDVPVVACGGAGNLEHMRQAVDIGHAAAVAAGSMFVYRGKHRAVLISFPSQTELREAGLLRQIDAE